MAEGTQGQKSGSYYRENRSIIWTGAVLVVGVAGLIVWQHDHRSTGPSDLATATVIDDTEALLSAKAEGFDLAAMPAKDQAAYLACYRDKPSCTIVKSCIEDHYYLGIQDSKGRFAANNETTEACKAEAEEAGDTMSQLLKACGTNCTAQDLCINGTTNEAVITPEGGIYGSRIRSGGGHCAAQSGDQLQNEEDAVPVTSLPEGKIEGYN